MSGKLTSIKSDLLQPVPETNHRPVGDKPAFSLKITNLVKETLAPPGSSATTELTSSRISTGEFPRIVETEDASADISIHHETNSIKNHADFIQQKPENLAIFLRGFCAKNLDEARDYLGKLGEALGKKNVLLDFAEFFDDPKCIGPNVNAFNRFDKTHHRFVQKMKEHKLVPDAGLLKDCILSYNYPYIQVILDNLPDIISPKEHIILLNAIQISEDARLSELILKKVPELAKKCPPDLIKRAVLHSRYSFIEWLEANGRKLREDEAKDLLSAQMGSHIPLIKLLCKRAKVDERQAFNIDALASDQMRLQKLRELSIFSPIGSIYAFVADHPEFDTSLRQVISEIAVFWRYPNLDLAMELNSGYSDLTKYVTRTYHYARGNLEDIEELEEEMEDLTRDELLERIVEYRSQRNDHLEAGYKEKSMNFELNWSTPFYEWPGRMMPPLETHLSIDPGMKFVRYSWCLRHLARLCLDDLTGKWDKPEGLVDFNPFMGSHGLQYYYPYKTEGEVYGVPTNSIDNEWKMMMHTHPQSIRILQEHLQQLHDELLQYPLDMLDNANRKEFFKRVAEGYWLLATLVEYHRGIPHISMIWLQLIYRRHNLPMPIHKPDHFLLDTTMLVTPFEKAIADWESYFEPTLDQSLKESQGERWEEVLLRFLSVDGLLLRQCSPVVRNTQIFIEAAARKNPDAQHQRASPLPFVKF